MENDHTRTPVMTILSCPYVEQRNECVQLEAFHVGTTSSMITGLQTYTHVYACTLIICIFTILLALRWQAGLFSAIIAIYLSMYVCQQDLFVRLTCRPQQAKNSVHCRLSVTRCQTG